MIWLAGRVSPGPHGEAGVRLVAGSGCARCHGKGCQAGSLLRIFGDRQDPWLPLEQVAGWPSDQPLAVGLDSRWLMGAAAGWYGLPVLSVLLVLALAAWSGLAEPVALLLAVVAAVAVWKSLPALFRGALTPHLAVVRQLEDPEVWPQFRDRHCALQSAKSKTRQKEMTKR
ncbi:MAG: hypothetical protein Kow0020_11770 [Wenzhouxiangellaceae bacterium]